MRHPERGAIMVYVVIAFVGVLMAAAALVVDVGRWLIALHEAQNAADAAALAGMQELLDGMTADEDIPDPGNPALTLISAGNFYWTDPLNHSRRCRIMYINSRPDNGARENTFEGLFGVTPGTPDHQVFHYASGNVHSGTSYRPNDRLSGWYGVKYAVMAAIAQARFSYLNSAALTSLNSGRAGADSAFQFNQGPTTLDTDTANYGRMQGTVGGKLTVIVQRGYECRVRSPGNCTAGNPCTREFRSLETPIRLAQQKGILANAVRVTVVIHNVSTFFFRFLGRDEMNEVRGEATASAVSVEAGQPRCFAARRGLDCMENEECDPWCEPTWDYLQDTGTPLPDGSGGFWCDPVKAIPCGCNPFDPFPYRAMVAPP